MTEKLCTFISYKREDHDEAEKLWHKLNEWDCVPWLDVKDISPGVSRESSMWTDAIHKGLKKSQVLIGVITPESLRSENVQAEWNWAKFNHRRILLLRLRPFDLEDMPPLFVTAHYLDLCDDPEAGYKQLQRALEGTRRDRADVKADITPPPVAEKPKPTPAYLLEKPTQRRRAPWRLTLRFLSVIAIPLSFLWLMTQSGFEPLLAFFGAIAALLGSWVGTSGEEDLSRFSKLTDYEQMRKRVYQYWVQGVMQTALKEVELAGIPLDMQPEAVVRDTRKNIGDIVLPNDSRHVRQVYDIFKSFLILGDPGAGKTIMLLQLAESLILNPPPTHKDAIPLVLNLSSWALHPKPLQEWLEDEVWRTYRVQGSRVRGWLKNNQLILLLDGLDEVKEEQRATCVEAINTFRRNYAFVPLVVCSRIKDYERLGDTKLELSGAIMLEALSQTQIDHYLSHPSLAHLKRVVAGDTVLKEMATTPFLLNTMIYAYRHEDEAAIRGFESEAKRREHLFDTYIQRRLKDNPSRYSYEDTLRYLQWLATKMQAYVQTVFHLEDIQPDWVADDPQYPQIIKRTSQAVRILYAVILTLAFAVVGWQMGEWVGLLAWGAAGALIGGVIAFVQHFRTTPRDEIDLDLDNVLRNIFIYLIAAPALGLILTQFAAGYMAEPLALLGASAAAGVLMFILFARDEAKDWKERLLYIALFIVGALWVGGVVWSIAHALQWSIWIEAVIVAILVVAVLAHFYLFDEQRTASIPHRQTTLRRVLLVSVLLGSIFGGIGALLNLGATLGIAATLTYAGLFNAVTLVYQPVLWLRLYQRKSVPVGTVRFLDALSERQILRQMGGGYIFIHRYLLENFARVDEVFILIDQLLADDDRTHDKAAAALINVGQSAVRPLRETLEQRSLSPMQMNRLVYPLDMLQPRPGVGLRADGLPDLVWCDVPAGAFLMGSDKAKDPQAQGDELPQREVTLATYKIAKYPVTYAQYAAFVSSDGYTNKDYWTDGGWVWREAQKALHPTKYWNNPQWHIANHPVVGVTWYESYAFCRWLSAKTGQEIRLPTEAEWEKAARGTDGRIYPYGDIFDAQKGNTSETKIGRTSAVGIFPDGASPYDVLDMSGNVWEWCQSKYASSYQFPEDNDANGTDVRVLRGGSWLYTPDYARAVSRFDRDPHNGVNNLGFRCARS